MWLGCLVAALVGMCVGAAVNRHSALPFQLRAQAAAARAQVAEQQLRELREAMGIDSGQRGLVPLEPEVHVHLHVPGLAHGGGRAQQPPVLDAGVMRELPAQLD